MSFSPTDSHLITLHKSLQNSDGLDKFIDAFQMALGKFRIKAFAYGCLPRGLVSEVLSDDAVFLANTSTDWQEEYEGSKLIDWDRCAKVAAVDQKVILWSAVKDLYEKDRLNQQEREFYLKAIEADYEVGATFPVFGPTLKSRGGIGLAFEDGITHSDAALIIEQHLEVLQVMVEWFHHFARPHLKGPSGIYLTPRALEALELSYEGKSIAQEREISKRAKRKYLEKARSALSAQTPEQAVGNAIANGFLEP